MRMCYECIGSFRRGYFPVGDKSINFFSRHRIQYAISKADYVSYIFQSRRSEQIFCLESDHSDSTEKMRCLEFCIVSQHAFDLVFLVNFIDILLIATYSPSYPFPCFMFILFRFLVSVSQ